MRRYATLDGWPVAIIGRGQPEYDWFVSLGATPNLLNECGCNCKKRRGETRTVTNLIAGVNNTISRSQKLSGDSLTSDHKIPAVGPSSRSENSDSTDERVPGHMQVSMA